MQNPRLATRYAKSILEIAVEQNQLEEIFKDMLLMQSICKSNKDFVALLKSPIIKADKKGKILDAILSGKISDITFKFNNLLVVKGREAYLPEIINAFLDQYRKLKGIYKVKLTTAIPVSEELKASIIDQLSSRTDMQHIELETAVKDELIGGFVLEMGDNLVDASIQRDLRDIRKQFLNNDFVYNIR